MIGRRDKGDGKIGGPCADFQFSRISTYRRVRYKRSMKVWIALLRGVNVGGNNILPMQELRELLEDLGCRNVRTYIQSGNCVFQSGERKADQIEKQIGTQSKKNSGFDRAYSL